MVHILSKGSRKSHLQEQAIAIFEFCKKFAVQLDIQWIPRHLNTTADNLSRIVDTEDWMCSKRIFEYYNNCWGHTHVMHLQATCQPKYHVFFARWWSPGCSGVDAFAQDWSKENCWCVPPTRLLARLYQFVSEVPCHATILFPEWSSAAWWPLWMSSSRLTVLGHEVFVPEEGDFVPMSPQVTSIFGPQVPAFRFVALSICSHPTCHLHL